MAGDQMTMMRRLGLLTVGLWSAMQVALLTTGVSPPASASPEHPSLTEVSAVVEALRFRGTMLTDPVRAITTYSTGYGRQSLDMLDGQMKAAGITGVAGWRFFLGTSVFTAIGIAEKKTLFVFYNPWIDSALFTVWQQVGKRRHVVDAAWVPGDLIRKSHAQIDPKPLWLRFKSYRPDALGHEVIATTDAIETRFGNPKNVANWRHTLGIDDAKTFNRLIVPMLALTLDETLLRLKALAVPASNEDAKFPALRAAVLGFLKDLTGRGFARPLTQAKETTATMKVALLRFNPRTMSDIAPVAYVAGSANITVFFASTKTADFCISVRFTEHGGTYTPAQIELIPYAATYQAAKAQLHP